MERNFINNTGRKFMISEDKVFMSEGQYIWHELHERPKVKPVGKLSRLHFVGDPLKIYADEQNQVFRLKGQDLVFVFYVRSEEKTDGNGMEIPAGGWRC